MMRSVIKIGGKKILVRRLAQKTMGRKHKDWVPWDFGERKYSANINIIMKLNILFLNLYNFKMSFNALETSTLI